jgi:diadenosine tetraphosphate (Ap4A) HIT family hydrolase
VAFKLPTVRGVHYVIVPKKDIKNVADLSEADSAYLTDAYLVARRLIERDRLSKYRFYTNGPGIQNVTYLHFHLIARLPSSTR